MLISTPRENLMRRAEKSAENQMLADTRTKDACTEGDMVVYGVLAVLMVLPLFAFFVLGSFDFVPFGSPVSRLFLVVSVFSTYAAIIKASCEHRELFSPSKSICKCSGDGFCSLPKGGCKSPNAEFCLFPTSVKDQENLNGQDAHAQSSRGEQARGND
jgi:hypothetical protein